MKKNLIGFLLLTFLVTITTSAHVRADDSSSSSSDDMICYLRWSDSSGEVYEQQSHLDDVNSDIAMKPILIRLANANPYSATMSDQSIGIFEKNIDLPYQSTNVFTILGADIDSSSYFSNLKLVNQEQINSGVLTSVNGSSLGQPTFRVMTTGVQSLIFEGDLTMKHETWLSYLTSLYSPETTRHVTLHVSVIVVE